MGPARLDTFLNRSLELIRRDAPECTRVLGGALGTLTVQVRIEDEVVRLANGSRGPEPVPGSGAHDVEVACSRAALIDLLEARTTLVDAALADRILVRAAPDDLVRLDAAWIAYLGGAVRSPAHPGLLEDFLGAGWQTGAELPQRGSNARTRP